MEKAKKKVAFRSVLAAIFLTGFKIIVGVLTGSLGILSEALHSFLDLIAASITYFSVQIAEKPADRDHHYGHGKFENLSALVETALLFITCIWIIYEAISRLSTGQTHIEITVWSYLVVVTSIVVDINRSRMLSRVAKQTNSQALEADALHFSTDIWSSSVVLLGLISAQLGWYSADAIAALGVAMIILFVSFRLGKKSIDVLLDKAPKETIELVEKTLKNYPEIRHYHEVKVRTAGADTFIKFNIHLDSDITLGQLHELCDRIESELKVLIPRSEISIHAEPHTPGHLQAEANRS